MRCHNTIELFLFDACLCFALIYSSRPNLAAVGDPKLMMSPSLGVLAGGSASIDSLDSMGVTAPGSKRGSLASFASPTSGGADGDGDGKRIAMFSAAGGASGTRLTAAASGTFDPRMPGVMFRGDSATSATSYSDSGSVTFDDMNASISMTDESFASSALPEVCLPKKSDRDLATFGRLYEFAPYKDMISKSHFGEYYKVRAKSKKHPDDPCRVYVMRCLPKASMNTSIVEKLGYMVRNLEKMSRAKRASLTMDRSSKSHENVNELIGAYEDKVHIFLISNYFTSSLEDYIMLRGKAGFSEVQCREILVQIMCGLEFLSDFDIIHGDLRPKNIMHVRLEEARHVFQLSNFSLAPVYGSGPRPGYLQYCAPELFSSGSRRHAHGHHHHHHVRFYHESDVWSAGVILFNLLFGRLPFDEANDELLIKSIEAGLSKDERVDKPAPGPWIPSDMRRSREAKQLVRRMLDPYRVTRISVHEVPFQLWFKTESLAVLRSTPKLQFTLREHSFFSDMKSGGSSKGSKASAGASSSSSRLSTQKYVVSIDSRSRLFSIKSIVKSDVKTKERNSMIAHDNSHAFVTLDEATLEVDELTVHISFVTSPYVLSSDHAWIFTLLC